VRAWPSWAVARTAILAWIELWHNRPRRHSALNNHAPVTFEEAVLAASCPAAEQ
jgi:transposase InsO family protein